MNLIERYVEQILTGSTPQRPLWNIEKIKQGKVNGWNYIDGCMMIADRKSTRLNSSHWS